VDVQTIRRLRCAAQGLVRPVGDPVARLLVVPAQDAAGAARAIEVRGGAGVDGLVLTWLHRGTLHLARREDVPWLHGLLAPRRAAQHRRRLLELGIDERRWRVLAAVVANGPVARGRLGELLGVEGPALYHLIGIAAMHGTVTLDPATRDVVPADLPPELPGRERPAALARLAARYLAGHAPADAHDLAAWSGLPIGEARAAIEACGVTEIPHEPEPVPRHELGPFDPYLLGWRDRRHAVPPELAGAVHPGGGVLRACTIEDGVVVSVR
jgi:hypothetical protein